MSEEVIPIEALGFSEAEFKSLTSHYEDITKDARGGEVDALNFCFQDLERIASLLDVLKDNQELSGLVATMISFINAKYQRKKPEREKYERSTVGMF